MLSRTVNQINQSPWGRLVWAGVAVLALVQVVFFYRLCTGQVARAQARETIAVQQGNALADCLDYLRNSTISSCARKAGSARAAEAGSPASRDLPHVRPTQAAMLSSAVPASYVLR
ncbi:MAG: hypothetical protein H7322_06950 [Ramlibacter sp.]|nr:hypothetical protein [Ramlibacter sp.]